MANDPNTIQYVIQEDGFWYIASKDRTPGVPGITVSSKGVANGLSTEYNDGYDFGPDTYNPNYSGSGIPYTQTSGIQEAVTYSNDNDGVPIQIIGSYGNDFIMHTGAYVFQNSGSATLNDLSIEITGVGNPHIVVASDWSPATPPIGGFDTNTVIGIWGYHRLVKISGLDIDAKSLAQWAIAGSGYEMIVESNRTVNTTDTGINITSLTTSGGTANPNKVVVRGNFCDGNHGADINTEGQTEIITNNMCFSGNGASIQSNIIAETAVSVIITDNHVANGTSHGITVESGSSNPLQNGKVVVANNVIEYAGNGIYVNVETSSQSLEDINIHDNVVRKCNGGPIVVFGGGLASYVNVHDNIVADGQLTSSSFGGDITVGLANFIMVHHNLIYNNSGIGNTRYAIQIVSASPAVNNVYIKDNVIGAGEEGGISSPGYATAPSPSLSTNPPVSATAYQNTNPYDILIYLPVYTSTSGTAGNVKASIGPTSTPATQVVNDIVNSGTSSSNPRTIQLKVPAGWYYEFTSSGVTFGTASVFAD